MIINTNNLDIDDRGSLKCVKQSLLINNLPRAVRAAQVAADVQELNEVRHHHAHVALPRALQLHQPLQREAVGGVVPQLRGAEQGDAEPLASDTRRCCLSGW